MESAFSAINESSARHAPVACRSPNAFILFNAVCEPLFCSCRRFVDHDLVSSLFRVYLAHAGCSYARLMTRANSGTLLALEVMLSACRGLTVKLDVLPHNGALGLVVLVHGHLDLGAVDGPSAYAADKVVEVAALEVQPRLQDAPVDLAHSLADRSGNSHAHQLLETGHVGNQVGVEVVGVQGRPEGRVVSALEQIPQLVQLLDGF
jgi:hypothetical protein